MNPKFTQINKNKLIEAVDATAFLNQLSGVLSVKRQTAREFRFKESSGVSLFLHRKTNVWRIHNHSDKLSIQAVNSDIWQFTTALHGIQCRTPDDFLRVLHIICDAAGLNADHYIIQQQTDDNTAYKRTKRKKIRTLQTQTSQPISESKTETTYKYKFADWQSEQGRAVLEYFDKKTGADIETLQRYNIRPLLYIEHISSGKITRFNSADFAFAYISPGEARTIKYKRPNAPKEYRERYIQNGSDPYVFGLDQVPDKCETIIIAAGEADTIALNHHFNLENIWAVCLRTESDIIRPELLQQLLSKAEHVVCLYDNDATGEKRMRINALKHRLPFIRLADYVNNPNEYTGIYESGVNKTLNDVCDVYQHAGINTLRTIINTAYRHTDARNDDERIIYQDYLSDAAEALKQAICRHDKINLKAATGAGKSTAIIQLALDQTHQDIYNKAGIKRFILAVPTTTIGQQLQQAAQRQYGHEIPFICGPNINAENQHAKLYITTYDGLYKIDDIIHESLLIVDESHSLAEAMQYRSKVCTSVFNYLNEARKVLLISATPHEYNGFTRITACGGNVQKLTYQPVYYSGTATEIDIQAPKSGHLTIIQINDLDRLKALFTKCQNKGISATIIGSQESGTHKDKNVHYQDIITTGTTSQQILLCTNLVDTGVSINQPIDAIHCFNPVTSAKTIQLAARGRKQDAINETIKTYVYHKRQTEYETVNDQHHVGYNSDISSYIKEYTEKAKELCDAHNIYAKFGFRHDPEYHLKGYDDQILNCWNDKQSAYIINEPGVIYLAHQRKKSECSNAHFYSEITAINPNATVLDPIEMVFTKDQETSAIAKELKQASSEAKKQAFDIFINNTAACLEAVFFSTNNGNLKQAIRKHIYVDRTISQNAKELYEAHRHVFESGYAETPAHRYTEIFRITGNENLSKQIVYAYQDRTAYVTKYNQLLILYKAESDGIQAAKHTNEIQRIYEAHRNTGRNEYTLNQLKQLLINAGILDRDKLKDTKYILSRINEVWQIEKRRTIIQGRKLSIYTILQKWTKKALIESANIDFEIAGANLAQSIEIQQNAAFLMDTDNMYKYIYNNSLPCPDPASR